MGHLPDRAALSVTIDRHDDLAAPDAATNDDGNVGRTSSRPNPKRTRTAASLDEHGNPDILKRLKADPMFQSAWTRANRDQKTALQFQETFY